MSAPKLAYQVQGQSAVSADNLNTFSQWCVNVPQLRGFIGLPNMTVYIQGLALPGDGGQGFFFWQVVVTQPDDGQNFIIPDGANGGGWVRLSNGTTTAVSISNIDGTLTLDPNPITGTGTISLNLGEPNVWLVGQTAPSFSITGGGSWGSGGLTVTQGPITPVSTSGIKGTTTNNNASAGSVGEYVESIVAIGAAVSVPSSGSTVNITTISLTAGDWELNGVVVPTGTSTALTLLIGSINTVSVTPGQLGTTAYNATSVNYNLATSFPPSIYLGPVRFSLAATTTMYLIANAGFSNNAVSVYGQIRARRVR